MILKAIVGTCAEVGEDTDRLQGISNATKGHFEMVDFIIPILESLKMKIIRVLFSIDLISFFRNGDDAYGLKIRNLQP